MKLVIMAFVFSFFYILFIGYFIYTHEAPAVIKQDSEELIYSSDSKYLVSVDYHHHTVKVVETATGKAIKLIMVDNKITDIAFSPDDRYLAYRNSRNEVKVVPLKNNDRH